MVIDLQLFGFAAPMYLKPLFITGLSIAAAMTANSSVASPFVSSGLAISAFETARTVRESADERMTQAVTDTSRADGGSIWLDLKAASDEADTMVNNAGFENDLAVVNLGADIRLGEAFFGVVYTYARADTESRGVPNKADGEGDIFGISAFGQRNFGGLNLALSAGWIYMSGDSDMGGMAYETNANLWTFDAAARYGIEIGNLDLVPYAKIEYTMFRPRHHGDWNLDNANIWQFPIGLNAAYTFEFENGMTLRPQIDFAVIRTAGDTEIEAFGAGGLFEETLTGSRTLYRGMVGLAWTTGKGTLHAGYRYLGSEQGRESHAFQLQADYVF